MPDSDIKPQLPKRSFRGHHFFNIVLVVIALIGVWKSISLQSQTIELKKILQRLKTQFGDLEIGDPALIHIRAIKTNEPLHFAWRVYVPANCKCATSMMSGGSSLGSSGTFSSAPSHFIARVRLYKNAQGELGIYETWQSGSSYSSVANSDLMDHLRENASLFDIELAGEDETIAIAPGQTMTILKISVPPELQAQHPEWQQNNDIKHYLPTVLQLQLN